MNQTQDDLKQRAGGLQDDLKQRAANMQDDLRQRASHLQDDATEAFHRADAYVRENPVPTILGALALGFLVGILVRPTEPTPRSRFNDAREDAEDQLRSLLSAISKKSKKAYKSSSKAVRDTLEGAADTARDIDIDDYTDPVTNWFRKLWKKAF